MARKRKYTRRQRDESYDDSEVADRKCLPCGKTFRSQHKGNRICPQCSIRLPSINSFQATGPSRSRGKGPQG